MLLFENITIRNLVVFSLILLPGLSFRAFSFDLKIAISATPNSLSPLYSTDANSQNILRLVHLSLIEFDQNMQSKCLICESFQEKMVKGRHVLNFKLKEDLKFWDGEKVTAQSVVNSLQIYLDPRAKSVFSPAFSQILEIKILDPHSFEMSYASFSLENISNLFLFKIIKVKDKGNESFDYDNLMGAGKFSIVESNPLNIKIKSNEKVSNKEVDQIDFKVVKDETTLALKLVKGEIDLSVSNMSPRKIEWLKKKSDSLSVHSAASTNFIYMGFNHRREHLKNVNIRKALSLLIPRDELQKYKLKETVDLSRGLFSKGFGTYYNNNRPIDNLSKEEAEKSFVLGGLVKNPLSQKWELKGKPFRLDWKVSTNKSTLEIVESIAHSYRSFGVEVQITTQEWGTWMKSMKSGQYDLVMSQWVGFTGPEMLKQIFHSEMIPPMGNNRGGYINKDFDIAVDLATSQLDSEKRRDLYLAAHDLAFDDYAYITLWHPRIVWISKKCLKNILPLPSGSYTSILDIKNECF